MRRANAVSERPLWTRRARNRGPSSSGRDSIDVPPFLLAPFSALPAGKSPAWPERETGNRIDDGHCCDKNWAVAEPSHKVTPASCQVTGRAERLLQCPRFFSA